MRKILPLLFLLAACGKHGSKSTAQGITGMDSGQELSKITGHLDSAAKLPRAGESKVRSDTFSSEKSGRRCRYTATRTFQVGNVTGVGLDETTSSSFAVIQGDSCPAVPKDDTNGSSASYNDADYIAAKKAELKTYFDLPARRQANPSIQAIGISDSVDATETISGHAVPVRKITIDIVNTNGVELQEVHEFATESWFLGRVKFTINVSGQSTVLSQVTSYNP